jgi:tetratricopeptide (TPR) repeat protein
MRSTVILIVTALLFAAAPAPAALGQFSTAQTAELDTLFDDLRHSPDEATARGIADRIWQLWTHPDDAELAMRVDTIIKNGGFAGPAGQLPEIEALVVDYPDYAEGYNLRATAHFLQGNYENALADVEETLAREPRHFGALAGRALILHTQGKYEEARDALLEGLEIHPFLPERSLFPDLGPAPIRS